MSKPSTLRSRLFALPLFALILALITPPEAARACIGYFGLTWGDAVFTSAVESAVETSAGYFVVPIDGESQNIVSQVDDIATRLGPVAINLEQILFELGTTAGVDCRHYEYGPANLAAIRYDPLSNYQRRLDDFFAVNAALFTGAFKVRALVVHSEANNACVEHEVLDEVAAYVQAKLDQPDFYRPRVVAAYGLVQGPTVTMAGAYGLPVDGSGQIAKFPKSLDAIGYTAYDVFDPNIPSHSDNLNPEPWDAIRAKVELALHPHQTTIGVIKAFCNPNGPEEQHWGVTCPGWVYKLGQVAEHWRDYLLQDPRNEGIYAFHWPDAEGFLGANALPSLWPTYTSVNDAINCAPVYDQNPSCDVLLADSFESGNTAAWDATTAQGGGIASVSAPSGLVGPQGFTAEVTGDGDRAFVQDDLSQREATYRARFYFRVSPATIADGNHHRIFSVQDTSPPWVVLVEQRRAGSALQLRARTRLDNGSTTATPWTTFETVGEPASRHRVEVLFESRTNGNGRLTFSVGDTTHELTGLDNDTLRVAQARLGMLYLVDDGTSGRFAFDEFLSCRD